MTLQARLEAFATRVATEFKAVRTSLAEKASIAQVDQRISAVVGSAPAAFDTLQEIAAQLQAEEGASGALVAGLAAVNSELDALTVAVGNPETDFVAIFVAALEV